MNELWKSLRKEELSWRQKSRVTWLKEGDKNTKFFHSMANGLSLKRLSVGERTTLEIEFSVEEVWMTLCSCDGSKASGPDGLNLHFVKANWDDIREDFMDFLKEFHKIWAIVKDLNRSFIALIPKVGKPENMGDFRPISLIESMYKVLAKVLANGIKKVMNSVISESQMAFVLGLSCVLKKATSLDLIKGETFNGSDIQISHLQFADDTILFLKPKMEYILNVKRILRCFEVASGLRINFHKSCLVRVGLRRAANVDSWAAIFKCKKANLPITYLGLPLGANPRSERFWNPVLVKIEKACIVEKKVSFQGRKNNRGLGIGRIIDKNKVLLAKWVWRFGREETSLWKKVICVKYMVYEKSLRWNWQGRDQSHFLKAVGSIFKENSRSFTLINDSLKVVIGCGDRAVFWNDLRWDSTPLRLAFPRIFALAVNKTGAIKEYDYWSDWGWVWEVNLHRPVFDWEQDQWKMFMEFIWGIHIQRNIADTVAWSLCPNGEFSVGSFRGIESENESEGSEFSCIWKGICPPKVEFFLWQLYRDRVMVKEVLNRFGFSQAMDEICPLCRSGAESSNHLFMHCSWSRLLWSACIGWWGMSYCPNLSVKSWVDGWSGMCPSSKHNRALGSLMFVVMWTIWETRNSLVFEGRDADIVYATDIVKFRVAWWFKHHRKGSKEPVTSLLMNIKDNCVEHNKSDKAKVQEWIPPAVNVLKFNVDGSARGKPGPAGIRGVLRDSSGKILCTFSSFVGHQESNMTELLAIQKAVEIVMSNPILRDKQIVVVSDSKVVVSWINNIGFGNLNLVDNIYEIRNSLSKHGDMKITHDSRAFNSYADNLARLACSDERNDLVWGDS
ncbi:hypothetical protein Dsin_011722 [Dipteronia sinensis]|uniref:RNase H type-1 domain-containing protein n=1 Tax=Dipteronia sinensis TaxID=43782 RepID=A0AAE0AI18_9ROSI|nr:hypothetical protein Dsin_011722 [Dipteronia sinensis]